MSRRNDTAIERWLHKAFLPYQLRWITDRAPISLCNKARQIAVTTGSTGGATLGGLYQQRTQIYLSVSEKRSSEALQKVREHCKILDALGYEGALDFTTDNETQLAWRTGGKVIALPANPNTARAESGDVWLDEFAYHQAPEKIRDGAFAMASAGGYRVKIFSTPNGAQGLFHEWVSNPPNGWSYHRVDIDQAKAQGFPVDLDKLWMLAGGDDRVFAQWYKCSFLDADLQYVPTALALQARQYTGMFPGIGIFPLYAGLDIGRTQDLTVLSIICVIGGIAWIIAQFTCKRTDFRKQRALIRLARKEFPWQSLHVDSSGLGMDMAQELVEWWGEEEVKLIPFTLQSKADLATRALRWLRDNKIRYPQDQEGQLLFEDTCAVRRRITPDQNITYEVQRTSRGHGDRWWALCLALKGAGEPVSTITMGEHPLLMVA